MKYLAMIQARCGSTRLPDKILLDLCGKPVLMRLIERVKKSVYVDEVMVVTSIEKNCLPVLRLCAENNIRCFAGSENDVLDRYYQAAKLLRPEYVIRLTADCPCFDAGLLDVAIEEMKDDSDYKWMKSETFADGLDLEIMTYYALRKAWMDAKLASEREHVTLYLKNHPELFKTEDFVSPIGDFGNMRWTIDELEDYELIKKIYQHFESQGIDTFSYRQILKFLDKNPQLVNINSMYARNEGLAKSLANDFVIEDLDEE